MAISFPPGAEDYYDTVAAAEALTSPIPEGYRRWRCVLCGYPQGDFLASREDVGVYCCGGCGQSCVRPIEEY